MKPLIVIIGPTASGKTDLAMYLAKKFNGEIVCADSRTIYKEMLIGTASPCLEQRALSTEGGVLPRQSSKKQKFGEYEIDGVLHYLLHFKKPNENFTVADFQQMAYKIIDDILKRGKIPFLVGGTGLYIDAVTKGFTIPHVLPNPALRQKLEKRNSEELFQELEKLDPAATKKINPKNKRRIIRALEVCLVTGQAFSKQQVKKKPKYDILTLGVDMPREELYQKIDQRVDKMIKMGLVDEVKRLIANGYKLNLPSMSGLGYKQIAGWLINHNPASLDDAVKQIKRDTRHFARRQITWFSAKGGSASGGKRDKSIVWLKNSAEAKKLIEEFLDKN